jgi:lysophospholipid acyltransferase (LPLAT)-like uncharacterized protein
MIRLRRITDGPDRPELFYTTGPFGWQCFLKTVSEASRRGAQPTREVSSALRINNRFVVKIAARAFAGVMHGLFWTLRTEFRAAVASANPYDDHQLQRYFFAVWHDSMVIPVFAGRQRHSVALTSQHRDGSFVSHVLSAVGIGSVRGSTHHGGANAVRRLMVAVEDKHVVITPDGPRGPRRRVSKGIVFLASRTGRAIVPTAFSCSRFWQIKGNWTNLVIPQPFAKVILLAGTPIEVPQEIPSDEMSEYVELVQNAMDQLSRELD